VSIQGIWGHYPNEITEEHTFRLLVANPQGLFLGGNKVSTEHGFASCTALRSSVFCLAETNVNWSHPKVIPKSSAAAKKVWYHSNQSLSHTKGNFSSLNQPGGTLTLVCNKWASRVIMKGQDPFRLGRLSFITAYWVCIQTPHTVGPKTSTSQPYRNLSRSFREAGLLSNPKPCQQFIYDLQAWIKHMSSQGYSIIFGIDSKTYAMLKQI
jgi:hypothetical protein